MNCQAFRDNHAAFLDHALDAADLRSMRQHLADCPACAAHDSSIRRAILLFRNLPVIHPSPEFSARLDARLHAVGSNPWNRAVDHVTSRFGSFATAALGVAAAGYMAVIALRPTAPDHALTFQPLPAARSTAVAVRRGPVPLRSGMGLLATDDAALLPLPTDSPMVTSPLPPRLPMWAVEALPRGIPNHFGSPTLTTVRLTR
jgi:anti-sigma factor RsiW